MRYLRVIFPSCHLIFYFWINHNIKHKFELYWLIIKFVKWQLLENKVVENPKMPKKLSLGINNFIIDLFNFKKACKAFKKQLIPK
jgi:hypothetical protein